MWKRRQWISVAVALLALDSLHAGAQGLPGEVGVVVMHGKGGGPNGLVRSLAEALRARGMRVRNLTMPWSGVRSYDVGPEAAEQEVARSLLELQQEGARRLFLVGHSQGGVFALHLAARLKVAGVVAVAPGGSSASLAFDRHLAGERQRARELVESGRAAEVQVFADFEGGQGKNEFRTRADVYWAWFDPAGAMNQERALRAVPVTMPVLYIAPTQDIPALRKANPIHYAQLPSKSVSRFAEPNANHAQAPTEAASMIGDWLMETAASGR